MTIATQRGQAETGEQASIPKLLIEEWLPIGEVGAESQRERGASSALPPVYFLHVWWARRPLTVSRAAVLASLLPAWCPDWPDRLRRRFPTRESYHAWFRELLGIRGDPVAARKLIQAANDRGLRLAGNPYGSARAFTINPSEDDLAMAFDLLEWAWGTREIVALDPMAGGGAIPFEALRLGLTTYANELNPVAAVILAATLDFPARFGEALADDIQFFGALLIERLEERLAPVYPRDPEGRIFAYIWAHTVACPTTGKPVPMSPNW